ncbi:MAG: magnesium transporter [Thermoplasmatota archaeon]
MASVEVLAGSFLGHMEESLDRLPGLLAMVPAILAMRGNISTSMGSRLGTQTRFGLIPRDRIFSPIVVQNLVASIVLGIILSVLAAVLAHVVTVQLGLESAGILRLSIIAVTAGLLSGFVMGGVAIGVMRLAFKRGLDLDNVAGPILMTASDVTTLLVLFATSRAVGVWM